MGSADRYADGEWNFYCDYCGRKAKSSTASKTWDNHYVCGHHKPARNPQDFLRGVSNNPATPWARPQPTIRYAPSYGTPLLDTFGNIITDTDGATLFDRG